jgi:aminoglycoside phosphotransferase (APT) family kinase protein
MWDQALPGLSTQERTAIYLEMNRVMAALHRVDPAAVGLAGYGRPGNYFERQIGRWSKQYVASATQPIAAMDALIAWLPTHIPPLALDDTQVGVVHGDYRLDNLVFHPTQNRIVAVLDWELSTLGHPLADFSYHCMAWHIAPGIFRGIGGLDHAAWGIPLEADYIRRYCASTGRADPQALAADWNFYLAYNLFRLASITQGIAKRVVDGTASSAQARATGDATQHLAALAWGFAQRAG